MKISWKLFKSEIKSKSASKKRSNLCYFLKYFCCVDLNCCQRSYGQSLEEKFQEGNKIQSIINNHKVNFNKLFLLAKWKLSRYEKNPSHAGAWNPLFLKHSFKIFPSTEETIDTLFPRGAWSSMADKFDWKFCGNRIECPSLDATRYARGLVPWPVMRHRTFGHAILYREALAEDSKAIYVAKRFLVVGAEPVVTGTTGSFLRGRPSQWLLIKPRDISWYFIPYRQMQMAKALLQTFSRSPVRASAEFRSRHERDLWRLIEP